MGQSFIPAGYAPHLSLYETQSAISLIKRVFQDALSRELNLRRVSAPLFVEPSSGLNDDLNGVERPVGFDIPCAHANAQVVHSLAKWKRMALYRYDIHPGKGIYTDMNAIRRDEELDNLHSVYVDQWDWEKVITPEARTLFTLHQAVTDIVSCICDTQLTVRGKYPQLCDTPLLRRRVTFVTAQELEDLYPDLTPKQRENAFTKKHGTVFIQGIGGKLRSGLRRLGHERRYPVLQPDFGQRAGNLLHGHPRQPGIAGSSVDAGGLRRPPQAAVPQNAAGRPASPDDGRRHRPIPPVHAAAGQGAYRRGAVLHLERADPQGL